MDHIDVLDAVKRAYLDLRDVYEHLSGLAIMALVLAVAGDSDRATWRNAMADTAGYAGRILLICLAAALPVGLAAVILSAFSYGFGFPAFVVVLIQGAAGVIIASLLAAIASRLYDRSA